MGSVRCTICRKASCTCPRPRKARWQARWRPPGSRKVKSRTFSRKREAEAFLADVETKKNAGTYRDPVKIRVSEYLPAMISAIREPATKALYASVSRRFLLPHLADLQLPAVTPPDLRALWSSLEAQGVGVPTIEVCHKVVSRMFSTAVSDGLLPANPASHAQPPRATREEIRIPSPEEVAAITQVIDPRYRAMVLVGAYAGLRIGEALGLRPASIRPDRILVVEALRETAGKVSVGPPKGRHRRSVPIPGFLRDELAPHMDGDLVFPAPAGGPLPRSRFRARFWVPSLGGLDGLHFHHLRHFFAALLIAEGAHPKTIADLMGHSSIRVTMDLYGHLFPSLGEDLATKLDAVGRAAMGSGGRVLPFSR